MSHLRSLANLHRAETGRVKSILGANLEEFHQLLAAGLRQDARIQVIQNGQQHVLLFAGDWEVALDRCSAGCVWVEEESV